MMRQFKYQTEDFTFINSLREKLLNGKALPEYIFNDPDWKLTAFLTPDDIGGNNGIFHQKLCSFLKEKRQENYFIFILFRIDGRLTYFFSLPIVQFDLNDANLAYYQYWNNAIGDNGMQPYNYAAMYLIFNDSLDWFYIIEGDVGISMMGVKTDKDLRSARQIFKDGILPKTEIADNAAMIAHNFREEFWRNYSENFVDI